MDRSQAMEKLTEYGQQHVLEYFDALSEEERSVLLAQIERTDFSMLRIDEAKKEERAISPIAALTLDGIEKDRELYLAAGAEQIKQGKAAAVLLAGGMGTRLGSSNPKGMFNIGINRDLYIFECLFRNALDVVKQVGAWFHFIIMTSELNDGATRKFLAEHHYFGFAPEYVHFFVQDTAAATDYDGKIYMKSKYEMAVSPNGNGGWYSSMKRCGLTGCLHEWGVKWLNVFAVDNVLQRICDPLFVGACEKNNIPCGAKVVRKNDPDEKVGVMCRRDGAPSIVEYYELTDELRDAVDEKGERLYNFGVILNYLFDVSALDEIADKRMPLHKVEKKIPYMDKNGELISPEKPNGFKYESLVLDMIEMMGDCLPFEVVREKEFAPVKNATGVDSVETARELLRENGVEL